MRLTFLVGLSKIKPGLGWVVLDLGRLSQMKRLIQFGNNWEM